MVNYTETRLSGPVLIPREQKVNEMFLATYDVRHYGGCEFACPYCDGWHFSDVPPDSPIKVHTDCPERLERELPNIPEGEVFGLTKGEPYQPAERQYRITRKVLHVLAEQHRPVVILTKSPVVCDDIPILKTIHRHAFAVVIVSMVAVDPLLSRNLEARAPSPDERIETIARLKQAGIPCGAALIPLFPFLTDTTASLTAMFDAIQAAQPDFVVWDWLWIHQGRHRLGIWKLLSSIDRDLPTHLERLYQGNPQPSPPYRETMTRRMLSLCRQRGISPRIPPFIYERVLAADIAAEIRRRYGWIDAATG